MWIIIGILSVRAFITRKEKERVYKTWSQFIRLIIHRKNESNCMH